jgi:hypothetical protein
MEGGDGVEGGVSREGGLFRRTGAFSETRIEFFDGVKLVSDHCSLPTLGCHSMFYLHPGTGYFIRKRVLG